MLFTPYYAQRASAGLILSEGTQISQQGQGYAWTPGIHTPEQVAGWRGVTEGVQHSGLGIAHHASWLFTDVLASGEVVRILDQHAPPPFPINAVTAAGRRMPSRVRLFIDFLAAICAEEPELRVGEG